MFLLTMLVIVVLAACSGNNANENNNDSNNTNTNDVAEEGGTLIFARGADSVSLDPIDMTDGESLRVTNNIFETLFVYDEDLELQPGLAEDYEVAEDGKTWTLNLKEGIKFHDGTDFNADAVVFNFERWMDLDHPNHNGDFAYYPFLFGGFKGEDSHLIEYVEAIDESTLEFKLTDEVGGFITYLTVPFFGIASPTAIEEYGDDFYENPVGTGPFKYKSWARNDEIILEKNEDYHEEGKPKLDQLIIKTIPDNSARLTSLLAGDIDMMDGLNPDESVTVDSTDGYEFIPRPSFNFSYMAFNMEKEPFDDVKVRKAIDMAINKDVIVDSFFNGLAEVSTNAVPPSLWGFNDEIKPVEFDVDAAKELLAEAGYEDGFETTLFTMDNPREYLPEPMKIAEAIQANLSEIGITTEIVTYEWATYLEKASQGEHEMGLFGWTGVLADPDDFLFPNFSSIEAEKPASNYAFYRNEDFTQLLLDAKTTLDENERAEMYKEAQQIQFDDRPVSMLAHTTPPLALSEDVKGFVPHPMTSDNFANVSLSQ